VTVYERPLAQPRRWHRASPRRLVSLFRGEEAVIVVWQVGMYAGLQCRALSSYRAHTYMQLMPSGGGSGSDGSSLKTVGKGPIKSADSMTFFARVGALCEACGLSSQ